MKERVKAYLESVGAKAVQAVNVTIGDETWEGARYHQDGERFYLIGKLPKGWKDTGSSKVYFTLDSKEYYIAAYLQDFDRLNKGPRKYHPFGNNWIMYLWEHDDTYRETPCKRQKMIVS